MRHLPTETAAVLAEAAAAPTDAATVATNEVLDVYVRWTFCMHTAHARGNVCSAAGCGKALVNRCPCQALPKRTVDSHELAVDPPYSRRLMLQAAPFPE